MSDLMKRPGAMPKPCPAALAAFGVPAKKWVTRTDLLSLLEEARDFLDSAPNGTSMEVAASRACLSPFHFAHRFCQTFGVSPATYHRASLMRRAKLLLKDHSVSWVATELGFQSASAFGRSFRRSVGISPGRWKETQDTDFAVEMADVPPLSVSS